MRFGYSKFTLLRHNASGISFDVVTIVSLALFITKVSLEVVTSLSVGINPISPGLYKNLLAPGGAIWPPLPKTYRNHVERLVFGVIV